MYNLEIEQVWLLWYNKFKKVGISDKKDGIIYDYIRQGK